MSIEGLPLILFNVVGARTWYKADTMRVDKDGLVSNITNVSNGGSMVLPTMRVNKDGLVANVTDVSP